ncbi:MAG: hypothetical protein RR942_14120 [Romboutsia sp.]
MFERYHLGFRIEISYTDGTKQEINYDYGRTYENKVVQYKS